jgi:predicted nucleic acid-binding protein
VLVKLLVREPETAALTELLTRRRASLATSAIALVEVLRAVRIAEPGPAAAQRAHRRLDSTVLVDVTRDLLEEAASYTSARVRALDAIHLVSALRIGVREMLVYDRRLAEAAAAAGLEVLSPGA